MAERVSQNMRVLKHLTEIGSLTRAEAYELYGITELNTRICNLRSQGYEIITSTRKARNRYGRMVDFAEYTLIAQKAF